MIRVELPIIARSVANLREHWSARARRAKDHRGTAAWGMRQAQRPELPCMVTLTRVGPRSLDTDNLSSSLKACRDGVADWLGVDDADPRVQWRYSQLKSKGYSVIVEMVPAR